MPRRIFVLGGVRSGKSTFAERLAAECGEPVLYVATASASDAEMAERIRRHRAQRPSTWRTIEEPMRVAERLKAELGAPLNSTEPTGPVSEAEIHAERVATVLVEDLTLLLSNLMDEGQWAAEHAETAALTELDGLMALPLNVIVVSNEVGMGVVPPYPAGRVFRDSLGRLNQAAAAACDEVYFVVAGLPLRVK